MKYRRNIEGFLPDYIVYQSDTWSLSDGIDPAKIFEQLQEGKRIALLGAWNFSRQEAAYLEPRPTYLKAHPLIKDLSRYGPKVEESFYKVSLIMRIDLQQAFYEILGSYLETMELPSWPLSEMTSFWEKLLANGEILECLKKTGLSSPDFKISPVTILYREVLVAFPTSSAMVGLIEILRQQGENTMDDYFEIYSDCLSSLFDKYLGRAPNQ